ncbi:MAG TPA: zinc-dependent alcohol dehydrogenase family protein [Pyrinomonadaceae bacterium]|nr:zinc-dependent alcohol dehydrogenase family protein [Pyrinomonadaceae bacterium]
MKGWTLRAPGPVDGHPLELTELPVPVSGADEVLVRVSACGICRTDLHVVEGELEVRRPRVIPGHQIVGRVAALGQEVKGLDLDQRVGIAWLHRTCGVCPFCTSGRENLCEAPQFTGWTVNGGFAEMVVAPAKFVYSLPHGFDDIQAAPLLCAGIIGYRALRLTRLDERQAGWTGARLGIYGFGAAGHVCIQLARARGADVYVATRDRERHQALALELGATWVGDAFATPPVKLDAAIIFAPAGELVPVALRALDKGGTLVLGGIHMSDIPSFPYSLIYGERSVSSVANNTRDDGREFLAETARIPVHTHVHTFPFTAANEALIALKHDAIRGAAVLLIENLER